MRQYRYQKLPNTSQRKDRPIRVMAGLGAAIHDFLAGNSNVVDCRRSPTITQTGAGRSFLLQPGITTAFGGQRSRRRRLRMSIWS